MTDYLRALALLLELNGLRPMQPDAGLAEILLAYGPGIDGEPEREHMGYRRFNVERIEA